MMTLPAAILFDLDDTILSTGKRIDVLSAIAEEFSLRIGDLSAPDLTARLDTALEAFWSDPARHKTGRLDLSGSRAAVIKQVFRDLDRPELTEELAHEFSHRFGVHRESLYYVYDGAIETIERLRASGVKLALVTNGAAEPQRAKIERFSLAPLFDHIQIEGEHGFGKPEDRAYRHALEALAVEPAQTWMVGDNLEWEVRAPQRLGIFAIWHDHLGTGLPAGTDVRPDRIIRFLPELLEG